ncbi:MAG: PilW family protein [Deltaproteobacteria bacterium]|nr:PilW family protein [Deltaproteobacteria bacterium]
MMANKKKGFSLVELLIAMAIGSIVMASIYTIHRSQLDAYVINDQVVAMQQNLRSAIHFMLREIRTAGYDPLESGRFGITDIRQKDLDDNVAGDGNGSLEFTLDRNENGILDGGDETIYFALYDHPEDSPDGKLDLARRVGPNVGGGGRQLIAENITAIGLAYGFDNDGDGSLDRYVNTGGEESIYWAVDSDNDNFLDLDLDTNADGVIDKQDDGNGNRIIDGRPLPGGITVGVDRIRAVRIWLLAQAERTDSKFHNSETYVVGDRLVVPQNQLRMRLLESTVECRNLGL